MSSIAFKHITNYINIRSQERFRLVYNQRQKVVKNFSKSLKQRINEIIVKKKKHLENKIYFLKFMKNILIIKHVFSNYEM